MKPSFFIIWGIATMALIFINGLPYTALDVLGAMGAGGLIMNGVITWSRRR